MPTPAQITRFNELHQLLIANHGEQIAAAEELAANVLDVAVADADAAWKRLWHLPLWANANVAAAEGWLAHAQAVCDAGWEVVAVGEQWALDYAPQPGMQWMVPDNYVNLGPAMQAVHDTGVAKHRLYAIKTLALALQNRVHHRHPLAHIAQHDNCAERHAAFTAMVDFDNRPGWGQVTVTHALAECGLGVKCDLHVNRTVNHIVDGNGPHVGNVNAPTRNEMSAVNNWVRELDVVLHNGVTTPQTLRYLDKVLMEISRCGLIPQP